MDEKLQLFLKANASLVAHPAFAQIDLADCLEHPHELLNALASCVVEPNFTFLLAQQFRQSLMMEIVARLTTDHNIKIYCRSSRTSSEYSLVTDRLLRNELILSSLVELIAILPHIAHLVHIFCQTNSCFLDYLSNQQQLIQKMPLESVYSSADLVRVQRIAYIGHKLLTISYERYSSLWNWKCFLYLCFHQDNYTKLHASKGVSILLRMDEAAKVKFFSQLNVDEDAIIVRHQSNEEYSDEYCDRLKRVQESAVAFLPSSNYNQESNNCLKFLHGKLLNIYGIVFPLKAPRTVADRSNKFSLIQTKSLKGYLRQLAIFLGLGSPILVEGPTGCGKTSIIRELGLLTGNPNIIELHLDDQIDSKTLLGTYVCTDVPGEFTWQPGALTRAVKEGRWVLIEDIDRAPFEVLAALMPLLESRQLVLSGRGEVIKAKDNFQLFATRTIKGKSSGKLLKGFQQSIWTTLSLEALSKEEASIVVKELYKSLPPNVIASMLDTFYALTFTGDHDQSGLLYALREKIMSLGREFSLRDLLKWCNRIQTFGHLKCKNQEHNSLDVFLTENDRLSIVSEGYDVFCAGILNSNTRLEAALTMGQIWNLTREKIENHFVHFKPEYIVSNHEVNIGRVRLSISDQFHQDKGNSKSFAMTGHVLRLMEKLGAGIAMNEPVLLVGETGCGKTTIIQHLARSVGQTLIVQNLNVQSDSSDVLGGYKPVELYHIAKPLYLEFCDLFSNSFSSKQNAEFLNIIRVSFEHKEWKKMVKGMMRAFNIIEKKQSKKKRGKEENNQKRWENLTASIKRFDRQREQVENSFAFAFVEGALVQAVRNGHWVLLDEINLASSDMLERLSTLLENKNDDGGIFLTERGDVDRISPHKDFRLFAAMNPPTDIGKKDLPQSLRNRFTEFFVDELVSPTDLQIVVSQSFREIPSAPISEIVDFYLEAKRLAESVLSDGGQQKPRYSLRTLCRALDTSRVLVERGYGLPRGLFEGFSMSFNTQLDFDSRIVMEKAIKRKFAKNLRSKDLQKAPPRPGGRGITDEYLLVSSYWLTAGKLEPLNLAIADSVTNRKGFVITKSVESNLRHLARACVIGRYPVLLQGPTSAGKTSLVGYLAARIGQKCVRINNHEHTDLQEYLGCYVSDSNGRLVFQEGVLVEAVRKGWWIILDELNLAPSEVLEALNRLLDDNRELYLSETQEVIKPHDQFMLFATQNPPGLYGGRKVLSRAFRNRFVEIQVDEVPSEELQQILEQRSSLAPSYCSILVDIMKELQMHRQQSSVFSGKTGLITTRDLLRWAERKPSSKQSLAEEGYYLLAERLRREDEKIVVKEVLEKNCKVKIDLDVLYNGKERASNIIGLDGSIEEEPVWGSDKQFQKVRNIIQVASKNSGSPSPTIGNSAGLSKIAMTKSLKRLFTLVGRCLQHEEPVLLVGETGCGKTTVCQLYSLLLNQSLQIVNCHQHTETADFLGSLRPVRGKDVLHNSLNEKLNKLSNLKCDVFENDLAEFRVFCEGGDNITKRMNAFELLWKKLKAMYDGQDEENISGEFKELYMNSIEIQKLKYRYQSLFEWHDGPLVSSMKNGDLILLDEINLAEDAVLERLNSVLEPTRALLLAEKGGKNVQEIKASQKWRIFATMNPGGDFGKRELSPALRNRFTEIWVPAIDDFDDLYTIISDHIERPIVEPKLVNQNFGIFTDQILNFIRFFNTTSSNLFGSATFSITLRDILSWVHFMSTVVQRGVDQWIAFVHGAYLTILDGLGLGSGQSLHVVTVLKEKLSAYLVSQVPNEFKQKISDFALETSLRTNSILHLSCKAESSQSTFGIAPFFIPRGELPIPEKLPFSLQSQTTVLNLFRILRSMQLSKPILLEGSPGVGKTSLVTSLAAAAGHKLIRINLSEQTDVADLFGCDLPIPDNSNNDEKSKGSHSKFAWCDGVFLRALKAGDWVLLDELNLASQAVLEGLNSCLDHRGTVYIPELDREFICPTSFRVFAAQNPLHQGGGRKGLPKSFLNRFTRVYMDSLCSNDLVLISNALYPQLAKTSWTKNSNCNRIINGKSLIENMVLFNETVHSETMKLCLYGRSGAPWEFNLRDIFRWCKLVQGTGSSYGGFEPEYYVHSIYLQRMRTRQDRKLMAESFTKIFDFNPMENDNVQKVVHVTKDYLQIGRSQLSRNDTIAVKLSNIPLLNRFLEPLETVIQCVNMNWPVLVVGPPASGKTASIRLLAELSGNRLHEMALSSGTDATELLGCFEQVDFGRKIRRIWETVLQHVRVWNQALLLYGCDKSSDQSDFSSAEVMSVIGQIHDTLWSFGNSQLSTDDELQTMLMAMNSALSSVETLIPILKLKEIVCASVADEVLSMKNDVCLCMKSLNESKSGCFEWIDGSLLQAMEKGDWILLDNVNFCSASVLDRLNSMLEIDGELMVNECGIINGKVRVVKPHPNFRIFLAMDPQFGEISRAMRNRCVEVALFQENMAECFAIDNLVLLNSKGVPGFVIPNMMLEIDLYFKDILQKANLNSKAITTRNLGTWAGLITEQCKIGISIEEALRDSFTVAYPMTVARHASDFRKIMLEFISKKIEATFGNDKYKICTEFLQLHFPGCITSGANEIGSDAQTIVDFEVSRSAFMLEYLYLSFVFESNDQNTSYDTIKRVLSITSADTHPIGFADSYSSGNWPYLNQIENNNNICKKNLLLVEYNDFVSCSNALFLGNVEQSMGIAFLPFAIKMFFQLGTPKDFETRLLWLKKMKRIVCDPKRQLKNFETIGLSFEYFEYLVRADDRNIFKCEIEKLWSTMFDILSKEDCHIFSPRKVAFLRTCILNVPLDLRLNWNLFLNIENAVQLFADSCSSCCNDILDKWEKINYVLQLKHLCEEHSWQDFIETKTLQSVDCTLSSKNLSSSFRMKKSRRTTVELKSFSIIQQSYSCFKYHADKMSVENEVIPLLIPFIKSIDELISLWKEKFLLGVASNHILDKFYVILRCRSSLFDCLNNTEDNLFPWNSFLIHWRWLSKSFSSFISSPNYFLKESTVKVKDLTIRIEKSIEASIGCRDVRDTLWKIGGHVQLPRSLELWNILESLESLSAQTKFDYALFEREKGQSEISILSVFRGEDSHPLLYAGPEIKKDVLHAICTVHWAARDKNTISEKKNCEKITIETLPRIVEKKLKAIKSDFASTYNDVVFTCMDNVEENRVEIISSTNELYSSNSGKEIILCAEDSSLVKKWTHFQLSPLFEHGVMRMELQAMSDILELLYLPEGSANYRQKLSSLLKKIETIITALLNIVGNSSLIIAPYKDFLWASNSIRSDEIVKLDEYNETIQLLKSYSSRIFYYFHERLQSNGFNDIFQISGSVFRPVLTPRKTKKNCFLVTNGLPRLFQSLQTSFSLKILDGVHEAYSSASSPSLVDITSKISQLHSMVKYLRQSGSTVENLVDMYSVYERNLFHQTLMCFEHTFEKAEFNAILELIGDLTKIPSNFCELELKIKNLLINSADARFVELVENVMTPLIRCLFNGENQEFRGFGLIYLGLWRFELLLPSSPLDPVLKPSIKKNIALSHLAKLSMNYTYASCVENISPQGSMNFSEEQINENVLNFIKRASDLSLKAINRPPVLDKSKNFLSFFEDLYRFKKNFLSHEKILYLIKISKHNLDEKYDTNMKMQIQHELNLWQQTTDSFFENCVTKYTVYKDVLEPVLLSILQMKSGFNMIAAHSVMSKENCNVKFSRNEERGLFDLACNLLSLPNCTPKIRQIECFLSARSSSIISRTIGEDSVFSVVEIALFELEAYFQQQYYSDQSLNLCHKVFSSFSEIWSKNEEEIEAKRKKDLELYKFKPREVEVETEESLIEKEFQEQFPDFSKEFDSAFSIGLEESSVSNSTNSAISFSDSRIETICEAHERIFATYCQQSYQKSTLTQNSNDFKSLFHKKYNLALLLKEPVDALSLNIECLDDITIGSSLFVGSNAISRFSAGFSKKVPNVGDINAKYVAGVDFHRDCNVSEALLVVKPLQDFLLHVKTILLQWPGHDILQSLVLLADRLRQLPITTSLAKLLSGIELLLRKSQEWEVVASKDVALSTELKALSSLVTRWRKLELYSWPDLLRLKDKSFRLMAQKSWFHLYGLLTSDFQRSTEFPTTEQKIETSTHLSWLHLDSENLWLFDGNFSSCMKNDEEKEWLEKLFDTLDMFIRSANIGEFQSRLVMLYSFCCQLCIEYWKCQSPVSTEKWKLRLSNMLYHLYRYYSQHLQCLNSKWKYLRTPIEKKLKDHVTISKWDEQTYYSLKESAEKSHRKLHKVLREYEEVLISKVQPFLDSATDGGVATADGLEQTKSELNGNGDAIELSNVSGEESGVDEESSVKKSELKNTTSISLATKKFIKKLFEFDQTLCSRSLLMCEDVGLSTVDKASSISEKLCKLSRNHLLSEPILAFNACVVDLYESFSNSIFSRLQSFKLKKVPKGAKKAALVDLLKELKNQGLTYLNSQKLASMQNINALFELSIPDVENSLRLGGLSCKKREHRESMLWKWSRADEYYYRYISQLRLFRFTVMSGCSKDLSQSEISRMSGYAENFLYTILQQRHVLTSYSTDYQRLLYSLEQFESILTIKELDEMPGMLLLPPQDEVSTWLSEQSESILFLRNVFMELNTLLSTINGSITEDYQAKQQIDELMSSCIKDLEACNQNTQEYSCHSNRSFGIPSLSDFDGNLDSKNNFGFQEKNYCDYYSRKGLFNPAIVKNNSYVLTFSTIRLLEQNNRSLKTISSNLRRIVSSSTEYLPAKIFRAPVEKMEAILQKDDRMNLKLGNWVQGKMNTVKDLKSDVNFVSGLSVSSISNDDQKFIQDFSCSCEKLLESMMLSIQGLIKLKQPISSCSVDDTDASTIKSQWEYSHSFAKKLRLNEITDHLERILLLIQRFAAPELLSDQKTNLIVFNSCLHLLSDLYPGLKQIHSIALQFFGDFLSAHKSCSKFSYIVIRVFRTLSTQGFCKQEQNDDGGCDDDSNSQFQDDCDGTGMGEGEGKKDVSNEIEDEEQLLGLKGEQQDEKEKDNQKEKNDDGVEMDNDFEGTMEDVPDEKEDDENNDEDEEKEEVDREMGEFEDEDENVVDEKMWGDDSDDEDDKIDKENEKFEKDAPMDGSEQKDEDEIRGKNDDEEDNKQEKNEKDKDDSPEQIEPKDENEGMINEDLEDNYEDRHDNIEQDEQTNANDSELDEELPNDMKLDDEDDNGAEQEGENEEMEVEEDEDSSAEIDDNLDREDVEAEKEDDNDDDFVEESIPQSTFGENEENEKNDEADDEEKSNVEDEKLPKEDDIEEHPKPPASGINSTDGKDNATMEEDEDDESLQEDDEKDENNAAENEAKGSSANESRSGDNGHFQASETITTEENMNSNNDIEREPNPYQSIKDAQEHWRRHMKILELEDQLEKEDMNETEQSKSDAKSVMEVVDENVDKAEQALAPVNNKNEIEHSVDKEEDVDHDAHDTSVPEATSDDIQNENKMDIDEDSSTNPLKRLLQNDKDESTIKEENIMDDKVHEMNSEQLENNTEEVNEKDIFSNDNLATKAPEIVTNIDQVDDLGELDYREKLLTDEEISALREELNIAMTKWGLSSTIMEKGRELYSKIDALTSGLSERLCEQLRLVLEPMLRTKLSGDYRTGKRINMKKIIPYIASDFRKDKIWLRRTKPSKRQYQVMVAIDDSESMVDNNAGRLALEAMMTLCKGMTQLEVGDISVVAFGEQLRLLHAFGVPFTPESGSQILPQFTFNQKRTNMIHSLDAISRILDESAANIGNSVVEYTQIVFVISDGRFDKDGRQRMKRILQNAAEKKQLFVLVIVDNNDEKNSILSTKSVSFVKGKIQMVPYLDNFPFSYYILIENTKLLPEALADALRQWFELLQRQN